MTTDPLPDILNGLVAAGTLALAAATGYTARIAVRAGLDASAPRVVVDWLAAEDNAVSSPGTRGTLPEIEPGTAWVLATQGDQQIGLEVHGQIRNEGDTTALVRVEPESGVEVRGLISQESGSMGGPPISFGLTRQGEWRLLTPGRAARLVLVWWRPASEWAASWDSQSVPEARVRLSVRSASGATRDHCELMIGGYVLAREPGQDGWVAARVNRETAGIPGTVPIREARIGLMQRSYPPLFRRHASSR